MSTTLLSEVGHGGSDKKKISNRFPRNVRVSDCQVLEHTLERGKLPEEIQRKQKNQHHNQRKRSQLLTMIRTCVRYKLVERRTLGGSKK